jgi:hypothetical protein
MSIAHTARSNQRRLSFFLCFFREKVFLLSLCPFRTPNPHIFISDITHTPRNLQPQREQCSQFRSIRSLWKGVGKDTSFFETAVVLPLAPLAEWVKRLSLLCVFYAKRFICWVCVLSPPQTLNAGTKEKIRSQMGFPGNGLPFHYNVPQWTWARPQGLKCGAKGLGFSLLISEIYLRQFLFWVCEIPEGSPVTSGGKHRSSHIAKMGCTTTFCLLCQKCRWLD